MMTSLRLGLSCSLALASACVTSHDVTEAESRRSSPERISLSIADLTAPVAISSQFKFPEGPVWSTAEDTLYLADITADGVYRFTPPDQLETILQPAQHPDGLALDPLGRVVAAGFGSRTVWRLDGDRMETLAASYDGKKLNSPDDLTIRSDGTIYFTDPTFGIDGSQGLAVQSAELAVQGVFRIDRQSELHLEEGTTSEPNGIALSPDETTLYVSYTGGSNIAQFSVQPDGSLTDKREFASNVLGADSMTVDVDGNVYVASFGGIAVFSADGTKLGTISVPQPASNVSFGGPDQRTLFITARDLLVVFGSGGGSLYSIEHMPVPGVPGRP